MTAPIHAGTSEAAPDTWRVICEPWWQLTATVEHRDNHVFATLHSGCTGQGPTQRLAVLDAAKGETITEVLAPGEQSRSVLLRLTEEMREQRDAAVVSAGLSAQAAVNAAREPGHVTAAAVAERDALVAAVRKEREARSVAAAILSEPRGVRSSYGWAVASRAATAKAEALGAVVDAVLGNAEARLDALVVTAASAELAAVTDAR